MFTYIQRKSVLDDLERIGNSALLKEHICKMMDRAEVFSDLDGEEAVMIAPYFTAYKVRKGMVVMSEGDNESYMFILVSGKLQVNKRDDDDVDKRLAIVRAGKSIGEMSVVDGQHHSATVIALEDSELLLINKNNFDMMRKQKPDICLKILYKISRLMSMRLRQTSGLLVDFLDE